MADAPRSVKAVSQGYALCTPSGKLVVHSYRETAEDAIASTFADPRESSEQWEASQRAGWTVEHVYARMFTPKFFADVVPEEKAVA